MIRLILLALLALAAPAFAAERSVTSYAREGCPALGGQYGGRLHCLVDGHLYLWAKPNLDSFETMLGRGLLVNRQLQATLTILVIIRDPVADCAFLIDMTAQAGHIHTPVPPAGLGDLESAPEVTFMGYGQPCSGI